MVQLKGREPMSDAQKIENHARLLHSAMMNHKYNYMQDKNRLL